MCDWIHEAASDRASQIRVGHGKKASSPPLQPSYGCVPSHGPVCTATGPHALSGDRHYCFPQTYQ